MIALPKWSTVIIGLNPALQKRLILSSPTLTPGQVHRAQGVQEGIGGKGQDVLVALSSIYQYPDTILLAQFLGFGPEGDSLLHLLRQQVGGNLDMSLTVRTQAKLRTCTTILSHSEATELVEPTGNITPTELQQLIDTCANNSYTFGSMTIMGTLPPQCPQNFYATLYQHLITQNSIPYAVCCLVDTVVGLSPILQAMAIHRKKSLNMIKINRFEISQLLGKQQYLEDSLSLQQCHDIIDEMDTFFSAQAMDYLAITYGKEPSYLIQRTQTQDIQVYQFRVPNLNLMYPQYDRLYPIGAGDAVAAGTVAAWKYLKHKTEFVYIKSDIQERLDRFQNDFKWEDEVVAFAFGLACGSASCLQKQNSVVDARDALYILNQVDIQHLH